MQCEDFVLEKFAKIAELHDYKIFKIKIYKIGVKAILISLKKKNY